MCLNINMMGLYVVDISLSWCLKANQRKSTPAQGYGKFCLTLFLGVLDGAGCFPSLKLPRFHLEAKHCNAWQPTGHKTGKKTLFFLMALFNGFI
jgi:hypothetical protein